MIRHALILAIVLFAGAASSQSSNMTQTLLSIGAGPFEFPISGTFNVSREQGATVFSSPNGEREIRVSFFRNPAALKTPEQIAKVQTLLRGNWERFAGLEKMEIVRPFKRWDLSPSLALFGMASQHMQPGGPQHYVQFAVTDGSQMTSLIVEGLGPAENAAFELEALVLKVKTTEASNSSLQGDAPQAARP
jgi:hypothetical protein